MELALVVLILVAVFLAAVVLKAISRKGSTAWPFYAKRVLSDPEQVLYWKLVEALPGDVVLAQVQLSRFLGVQRGSGRIEWLNKVNQKSADFVVCRKDFSVLVVIELDDATHGRASRQKADADKEKAVFDAGLRLLRWSVKKMPTAEEIRAAVYPPIPVGDAGGVGGVPTTLVAIRPARSGTLASRQNPQRRLSPSIDDVPLGQRSEPGQRPKDQ